MPVLKPKPTREVRLRAAEEKPPKESYQRSAFKEWAYKRWGRLDLEKGTGRLLIRLVGSTVTSTERGWPDMDVFIRKPVEVLADGCRCVGYKLVMIEWKRSAKDECTDLQLRRHAELRAMGVKVIVVCDQSEAKRALIYEMEGKLP